MELQFNCIAELGNPGLKFKARFDAYWPDYKLWLESEFDKGRQPTSLESSIEALEEYMPEILPLYYNLRNAVNADETASQFLTGFNPPPYLAACSQAVLTRDNIRLIRNYDYHPELLEGTILLSSWYKKKVIATTDCLTGVLDGINEDGLSVSLTFGGRNIVGNGFGIPFILRYILEFCANVKEAVDALLRIPCHMSYNVTVVDKTGAFNTVFLSPDREPTVTNNAFTTNHQEEVDWEENALFNKTVKRFNFLNDAVNDPDLNANELIDSFLKKPLYSNLFSNGFGTVYTAIYFPKGGQVIYRWPNQTIHQSLNHFIEQNQVIKFTDRPMDPKTVSALSKFKKKNDEDGPNRTVHLSKVPKNRKNKNLSIRKVDLRMG